MPWRAISKACPVNIRPWLQHPWPLWSPVQRLFLFASKRAPLGLTPPLVISLLSYSFLPLENRHHPNSQVSPQNNLSPISDLPLCWCEERTLKTQAVPWHCPAEAAALGQSCTLLTDLFSSFVALYTSFPLFVGREGSGERGVSIWIGLFFDCCFKEIHHQHPDKKKGSTCQAH